MKEVLLKVKGMTCEGCVRAVRTAIERNGGKEVEVSLKKGEARFLIAQEEDPKQIAKAVSAIGYPSEVLEQESSK